MNSSTLFATSQLTKTSLDLRQASTKPNSNDYLLGKSATEPERLIRQAELYRPEARQLLDAVYLTAGQRALDLGCGPLGILDEMAERVGATGAVVGLEREESYRSHVETTLRDRGYGQAKLIQSDASMVADDLRLSPLDWFVDRSSPPIDGQSFANSAEADRETVGLVASHSNCKLMRYPIHHLHSSPELTQPTRSLGWPRPCQGPPHPAKNAARRSGTTHLFQSADRACSWTPSRRLNSSEKPNSKAEAAA